MKSWLKKASILWMIGMTFLLGACNNESENNVKTSNEPRFGSHSNCHNDFSNW